MKKKRKEEVEKEGRRRRVKRTENYRPPFSFILIMSRDIWR
jgi:hypothetical protein